MILGVRTIPAETRRRAVLFGLVSILALFLGFFVFSPVTAVTIVHRFGYYWLLLMVMVFGYMINRVISWRMMFDRFLAGGWRVVLVILSLTAWIHIQEPHGFKIVNDEIQLVSTSQRMHFRREAATVARGYIMEGEYTIMQGAMDKRPLLFPFLVCVLHDFTGYRPENAFWLNALLTPVLFGLIYLVLREVAGRMAGVAGMLLFATLPLVFQVSAGAGFELLNLVMILLVFWLGLKYIQSRDLDLLNAFCIAGVLLTQVRYESVLYVFPIAAVVAYGWWLDKRISLPLGVMLAPVFLIITPLQANVLKVSPGLLQLDDRPSVSGVYSFNYFYDNVGHALSYFCSLDQLDSNSHLLAFCGVLGVGFFCVLVYGRVRRREFFLNPQQVAWAVFVLSLCAQAFLMLCYFWGSYEDMVTVRLSLPTQLLFALVFAYIYPELVAWRTRWPALIVIAIVYGMIWTMPVVAKRAYTRNNSAAELSNLCGSYIKTLPDKNILVLDSWSRVWSLYGVPCVGLGALAERVDPFLYHYRRGTFEECLLVQRLELKDPATGKMGPMDDCDLGAAFKLQTVKEFHFSPTFTARISRITGVDEAALRVWAKNFKSGADDPKISKDEMWRNVKYSAEWIRNLP